jgi:hypothetical protein
MPAWAKLALTLSEKQTISKKTVGEGTWLKSQSTCLNSITSTEKRKKSTQKQT